MIYLRYIIYFIPSLIVTWLCWLTNPIACLFPSRQADGTDKLWGIFDLWSTHDNPVDSFYYGNYDDGMVSNSTYNASSVWRYWYRLRWLKRNTGYGWSYLLFSVDRGQGFQFKGKSRAICGFYNDYNIGWKDHSGIERLSYAGRILGLRKVK